MFGILQRTEGCFQLAMHGQAHSTIDLAIAIQNLPGRQEHRRPAFNRRVYGLDRAASEARMDEAGIVFQGVVASGLSDWLAHSLQEPS